MPTPNFEDAPDGSSSVNHTGSVLSEESPVFWEDIDPWAEVQPYPPTEINSSAPPVTVRQVREALSPPPHPSYADGSAPLMPPRMTATQVNEARRRANPEWRPIPARSPDAVGAVPPNPVGYSSDFSPSCSPPRQSPRRTRRGVSDPDAAIRKDPNAWSMREAVELCKLLEVVVPEAGFHIALTGGLLYKEGRRKDCDLMFYQIRGVEPNYEVLWKYLTVAGVIRRPDYPENGWLVKATYRGKLIDCLFPNAKKKKTVENYYRAAPAPPGPSQNVAVGAHSLASNNAGTSNIEIGSPTPPIIPILYHRTPSAPGLYDPAELLATPAPASITTRPGTLVRHNDGVPEFAAPAPIPQEDIPF